MGRDVLPLTVDRLGDLTGSCADCVFWELGPALAARRRQHPREDKESWLTATLLEWGTPGRVVYVDGRFAGEVSLGSVQRGPFQMGYIGYWIDEALAGRGYVPEGVVLMMRHAFEALQLHRLEAAIVPRNEASRRVAQKLGLRDEGTAVRFLQIQGVYEDHVRYSITAEEWRERGHELVARFVDR